MGIRICSQRCASLCGIGSGLDCRSRFPSDVMLVFAVCADELDLSGSANVQPWLWKRDIFVAMMSLRDVAGLFRAALCLAGFAIASSVHSAELDISSGSVLTRTGPICCR